MKLKCIISGKEVSVPAKMFKQRAVSYGVSEDQLKTSYVSRESKRLLREGKTVVDIRTLSGISGLPDVSQDVIDIVKVKTKRKKTAVVPVTE
jgi:hypothetical protein